MSVSCSVRFVGKEAVATGPMRTRLSAGGSLVLVADASRFSSIVEVESLSEPTGRRHSPGRI